MATPGTLPSSIVGRRRSFDELGELLVRIHRTYRPVDVLLFGSRAKGVASDDSDWDIMVILPDDADESLLDPVLGWETQAGSGVHADVLASYRSEFIADLDVVNSRAREVATDAIGLVAV
jgi:uncharacterized protein